MLLIALKQEGYHKSYVRQNRHLILETKGIYLQGVGYVMRIRMLVDKKDT